MSEMRMEQVSFAGHGGKHRIAGYIYDREDVTPRAVIQLSHGMCEYIARYEWFAEFFTERGFIVAGNDHDGHGDSCDPSEWGNFMAIDLLQDLKTMNSLLRETFPGLPVILYGHSMGSFFARWYAEKYPKTIDGLVISGTGGPNPANKAAVAIASLIAATHKKGYVSQMMVKLNFGPYCDKIPDAASPNDWLTHDKEVVARYDVDPKCQFRFSAAAYREMLKTLAHVSTGEWAKAMPKELPVLILSGAADPVGDYGEGVKKVYAMLDEAGVSDLTLILDPEGRHELHNEINKEEVMGKVAEWLDMRLP